MANEVGSTRLGNDSRREQKLWSLDPQDLKKGSDYRNLAGLLRLCNIKHRDDRIGYFWSSDLITRIMTEDRVKEALSSECGISVFPNRWRVGRPFDDFDDLVELIREKYLKIFALLLLLSRGHDIYIFIEFDLRDVDLPLDTKSTLGEPRLYRHSNPGEPIQCFSICGWQDHELEFFFEIQWRLTVPYFRGPDVDGTVCHYKLTSQTILPWCPTGDKDVIKVAVGGFGDIERVRIDPSSHGFAKLLTNISLADGPDFAVKSIQNQKDFLQEVNMLEYLARTPHPHLISLLATFELEDSHNMIFPLADCDLYTYWETHNSPLMDGLKNPQQDHMFWITAQITGIVSALTVIHNVGSAYNPSRNLGRHGDLKADNILCFQSSTGPYGTLVLSDFGLSSLRKQTTELREATRDKIMAFTPGYRPPECDMEHNIARSRRSDIWSLGCLLLEMACWILKGRNGLADFHHARTVVSPTTGVVSSVYFEVNQMDTADGKFEFGIKKEVTNYIQLLHSSAQCTSYVHDLLELIEQHMLLVDTAQRATADQLLQKLEKFEEHAKKDKYYIMDPRPINRQAPDKLTIQGALSADAVTFEVNHEYNKARLSAKFSRATQFTQRSMRLRELVIVHPADQSRKIEETYEDLIKVKEEPRQTMGISARDVLVEVSDEKVIQEKQEVVQSVSLTVSRIYSELAIGVGTELEILINITWQLQQCLRDELESNPNLGSVLTISGDALHCWAAPCSEYVEVTWGTFGLRLFKDFEICLREVLRDIDKNYALLQRELSEKRETTMECDFSPIDEEAIKPSVIKFKGTVEETSTLCQLLAWIAATFRMPEKGEVSCSSVDFGVESANVSRGIFRIILKDLWPLSDREPGTCWKSLFPSTVMATGFPAPQKHGAFGLQIPFSAMLEMANILCDVNLEDENGNYRGVYFDGSSFVLYATGYFAQQNTVQWHLRKKYTGKERDPALRPDHYSGPTWVRHLSIETLSEATAILGYCGNTEVQLGTASRVEHFAQYEYSLASLEKPPPEISLSTLTASLGYKGSGLSASGTWRLRSGLQVAREKTKDKEYIEVLDDAEKDLAILFETSPGQERAWMVPQLSLILELFNFWAFKKGLQDIHYAEPGSNDGSGARKVLEDEMYINRPALKKLIPSDKGLCFGDIIKRIHNRIEKRTVVNFTGKDGSRGAIKLGNSGIFGWDWLELAGAPSISDRRGIPNMREPCWIPFTQNLKVPVFMCQNLGQLITPVNKEQLCDHWCPIPGGVENPYLVATVTSIQKLATDSGQKLMWSFRENLVWNIQGESLFEPCAECITAPIRCCKKPQILHKRRNTLVRKNLAPHMIRTVPQIKQKGAIVFAKCRKDENSLSNGRS